MADALNSNFDIVIGKHLKDLEDLTNAEKVLKVALFDQLAETSERVQQGSKRTDGQSLSTNFSRKKRKGDYSATQFYKRRNKGKQTSKIDFTFSGDMMNRDFQVIKLSKKVWGLGFLSSLSFDKYQWLRESHGEFLLPTNKEFNEAIRRIKLAVKNILR